MRNYTELQAANEAKIIVKAESYEKINELRITLEKLFPQAKVIANATDKNEHNGRYYFGIRI
jgi:hypothetical protein